MLNASSFWSRRDVSRRGVAPSFGARRVHAAAVGVAALALVLSACGGLGGDAAEGGSAAGDEATAAEVSSAGVVEIEVGAHYDDIRATYPDFPEQSAGTSEGANTVITYADREYVFDSDGVVVEVRPPGGGSGESSETTEASAADDGSGKATKKSGRPNSSPTGRTSTTARSRRASRFAMNCSSRGSVRTPRKGF
ncbi:hypothetical protein ACFSSF_12015 [Dietzia aerolata]|uniref:hypothetical protein n=1 Tax=Dietzia aerolata TaxID=595984 RepID=UPI003638022B